MADLIRKGKHSCQYGISVGIYEVTSDDLAADVAYLPAGCVVSGATVIASTPADAGKVLNVVVGGQTVVAGIPADSQGNYKAATTLRETVNTELLQITGDATQGKFKVIVEYFDTGKTTGYLTPIK
jgi:hypothetical protein